MSTSYPELEQHYQVLGRVLHKDGGPAGEPGGGPSSVHGALACHDEMAGG